MLDQLGSAAFMLKKLDVNGKTIPVPVPILSLSEAISWLESSILKKGQLITKIVLDGQDFLLENNKAADLTKLLKDSELSIQADSARDLAIQTIDALRDLTTQMLQKLQELAVYCWRLSSKTKVEELEIFITDTRLALELVNHVNGMVDFSHTDMAPVNGLSILIRKASQHLQLANQNKDWKSCSDLLLNRFEPLFRDLTAECEVLQLRLLSAENVDDQLPAPTFCL